MIGGFRSRFRSHFRSLVSGRLDHVNVPKNPKRALPFAPALALTVAQSSFHSWDADVATTNTSWRDDDE
jgi:hypothetical protein